MREGFVLATSIRITQQKNLSPSGKKERVKMSVNLRKKTVPLGEVVDFNQRFGIDKLADDSPASTSTSSAPPASTSLFYRMHSQEN